MERSVREEAGIEYHLRQAAHFRELAATATTPAMKQRLLAQAEEHEEFARGETETAAAEDA